MRLVVPFPPGGGTDAIARVLSGKLSDMWGHQLVVENRGGAATNIGTEVVARAEPDGYTMLLQSMPLTVNRFLFASLPYDAVADLAPVSLLCDYPNIMAVPMSSPARSVAEFIAHAKANKGKITFASSGHGTSVHLSGELFKRMAGIEMLHVPYRGAGPAFTDLIPGRVDVMFNNIGAVLPLIQGGKLRGLAVTTAKRTPAAPELPPIAEVGVPGIRRVVLVWVLRTRQDPARDRAQDARRHGRGAQGSGDQAEARVARRGGEGLDAGRARRLPQGGDGQVGPGDQGRRNFGDRRQIIRCGIGANRHTPVRLLEFIPSRGMPVPRWRRRVDGIVDRSGSTRRKGHQMWDNRVLAICLVVISGCASAIAGRASAQECFPFPWLCPKTG